MPKFPLFRRSSIPIVSVEKVIYFVVIVVLGVVTIAVTPPQGTFATWWPAAGASVVFALHTRPPERRYAIALIAVAVFLANILGGRTLLLAAWFGVCNATEVAVILAILTWRSTLYPTLVSFASAIRLFIAASVGGLLVGALSALAADPYGESDFWGRWLGATGAHIPAVLIVAPLAMIPPTQYRVAGRIEQAVQAVLLATCVGVVFGPELTLPLAFLVLPFVVWAALRFSLLVVTIEIILIGIAVATYTSVGSGPWARATEDVMLLVQLVEAFLIAAAALAVIVSASEYNRRTTVAELVLESERMRKAISEKDSALAREKIATVRVHELARQQEEFVASASHELRTPITLILGYSEILSEMDDVSPLVSQSASTIRRNAQRLADLVDDILVLETPAESGSPAESTADVTEVAVEVLGTLAPLAERNGVRLTLAPYDGSTLDVACSPLSLSRIIENLVTNGIKYAGSGKTVTVAFVSGADDATLTISDNGAGMSAKVLANAFVRFYRAPQAASAEVGGTGLGLPLVQGLVHSHGGTVELTSTPGRGTTATVRLPLASRHAAVTTA